MSKAFFCILSILLYSCVISYGCSCIGKESINTSFKKADVILVGKVIQRIEFKTLDSNWDTDSVTRVKYVFEVAQYFKRKHVRKKRQIEIVTGFGHGDCGYQFNLGEEYIVYSNYKRKFYERGDTVGKYLYTDICTRTCVNNPVEIKELENR